ncbi:Signal transduction histidine kinase [Lachnospiraceae bacterium G41]|nr:Signal transduction histidine kinase [Lachnospiraceae bacterium G41]
MRKAFKKLTTAIGNLIQKLIESIIFRISFFIIFALTVSNVLAGGIMMILYQTSLKDRLNITPLKLTIIVLVFSYLSSATLSVVINRNFFKPLRKLTKLTEQVAKGNYDVDVNGITNFLTEKSDLGNLVNAFDDMTQELSSTEIFRNDFIHNFSHEFKTPIISIRGFARQLYKGNLTPEQQSEFAKIIMDESEHLANMSSNVLLLSKLESQEIVSDKESFSLDEQLRTCMLMMEEQWSEKNLTIDMDLDEIDYYQNKDLLYHVWTNLFSNAVKFTKENGTVSVQCHRANDAIFVAVSDNGAGMDDETKKHIFEKFYQGDTSHATAGNGLGLSLVKRIVEMMDGRISVDSTLGKGSTFTVSLPLQNEEE